MKKTERNIKELAKGMYEEAVKCGLENDSTFQTSFKMIEVQIEMLDALEKSFREDGTTITKEYVKGRENIYVHPAIDKYTKTSDSCFNKILKLREALNIEKEDNSNDLDEFIDD